MEHSRLIISSVRFNWQFYASKRIHFNVGATHELNNKKMRIMKFCTKKISHFQRCSEKKSNHKQTIERRNQDEQIKFHRNEAVKC